MWARMRSKTEEMARRQRLSPGSIDGAESLIGRLAAAGMFLAVTRFLRVKRSDWISYGI